MGEPRTVLVVDDSAPVRRMIDQTCSRWGMSVQVASTLPEMIDLLRGSNRNVAGFDLVLVDEGMRKIDAWTARYGVATVEYEAEGFDPFFNVNTPADLAEAERLLAAGAD